MHSVFSGLPTGSSQLGRRSYPTGHFSASSALASGATRPSSASTSPPPPTGATADPPAMSQLQAMKKQVVQLHQEASIPRITVSQACEELMKYCMEHEKQDILVTGISPSDNPFKENKACTVL